MGRVQRVQDAALEMQAAGLGVIALDLFADAVLEGGKIGHADLLRPWRRRS
jgi:hypothetical protein